jgi:hypothetical protein
MLVALKRDVEPGKEAPVVVVVDDSSSEDARECLRRLMGRSLPPWFVYHGPREQKRFLGKVFEVLGGGTKDVARFVRRLGTGVWDLGGVRNYGVLLAVATGSLAEVCWLDDDVMVPISKRDRRGSVVGRLLGLVRRDPGGVVGGRLRGVADVSCVEAMMVAQGVRLRTILADRDRLSVSGGFLAYALRWGERMPHVRCYNEDWIWLRRLMAVGARVSLDHVWAWHRRPQERSASGDRFARETLGEVYYMGWARALEQLVRRRSVSEAFVDVEFWGGVRDEYVDHVRELLSQISRRSRTGFILAEGTVRKVENLALALKAERLAKMALRDVDAVQDWRRLCATVRRGSIRLDLWAV